MAPASDPLPTAADKDDRATLGLALLSFAAGSMDAIAFLALGGVFTSAMSGNTIILGLAISQGHFRVAVHAVTALLGYLLGVAIASLSLAKAGRGSGWTLGLEGLAMAAFAGLWISTGAPAGSPLILALIGLSAVAMGLQGGIGRAIGAPGIMTVIFTSTYTAIVGGVVERAVRGQRPVMTPTGARQLTALAAYFGGAVLAGVAVTHWRLIASLFPLAAILALVVALRRQVIAFDHATR